MSDTVYATRDLVTVLLEFAADDEPGAMTAAIAVTPAGELDWAESPDVAPETPVFTHFYHPQAAASVSAVFGVDLSTPPGRTQGRFVSHPQGDLAVDRTDDLKEAVLVAVPPWEPNDVAAFDRRGRRQTLTLVDAVPPEESVD